MVSKKTLIIIGCIVSAALMLSACVKNDNSKGNIQVSPNSTGTPKADENQKSNPTEANGTDTADNRETLGSKTADTPKEVGTTVTPTPPTVPNSVVTPTPSSGTGTEGGQSDTLLVQPIPVKPQPPTFPPPNRQDVPPITRSE